MVVDGILFASQSEADRYKELTILQKSGDVISFEIQPRYILQDAFKKNGKAWRAISYVADFRIHWADGHTSIEDVKGSLGFQTDVFKLKQKLFEFKYPELTLEIKVMKKSRSK